MVLTQESALRKDRSNATADMGALQHRHFAVIAGILRDLKAPREMCEDWADRLVYTNANFDRARFLRACQP